MKEIIKVICIIIGTLIGAGFASGQEMYIFFFSYGIKGIIGIFISSILMGWIIYKCLIMINENSVNNYKDFLDIIYPQKNKFNIQLVLNCIINIFVLCTFFIMVAGFGAYIEQQFRINSFIRMCSICNYSFYSFYDKYKRYNKSKRSNCADINYSFNYYWNYKYFKNTDW